MPPPHKIAVKERRAIQTKARGDRRETTRIEARVVIETRLEAVAEGRDRALHLTVLARGASGPGVVVLRFLGEVVAVAVQVEVVGVGLGRRVVQVGAQGDAPWREVVLRGDAAAEVVVHLGRAGVVSHGTGRGGFEGVPRSRVLGPGTPRQRVLTRRGAGRGADDPLGGVGVVGGRVGLG